MRILCILRQVGLLKLCQLFTGNLSSELLWGHARTVVLSSGFTTIGEAIAAAREVLDQDIIIRVSPGTYKERLQIDKPVTIEPHLKV